MSETVGVRFKKEVLEALKDFMHEEDLSRTEAVNILLAESAFGTDRVAVTDK